MSKKREIVEVFDEHSGEAKPYKLMSARLPDFLSAYPKEEGYQVKISTTDMLHSKPGLIRLYEAAIAANMAPNQAGLPPLPSSDIVIFTASLVDKEGRILESASATRHLTGYPKEWEKGETAARQRLIAALGFGGDCFDEDERQENEAINAKSVRTSKSKSHSVEEPHSAQEPVANESARAEPPENTDVEPEVATEPQLDDDSGNNSDLPIESAVQPTAAIPEKEPRGTTEQQDDGESGKVPVRIIRQIEQQAKLKGEEIRPFNDVKEAKAELKRLMLL